MADTQYIGSRYVPLFADPAEWSSIKTYEPLTVVLHQGNSYTSKQFVPVGIDIDNTNFWAVTGNYNAQVELYRRETSDAAAAADAAQNDIDTLLPKSEFSSTSTVLNRIDSEINAYSSYVRVSDYGAIGDGIADDTNAIQQAINAAQNSNDKKIIVFDKKTYKVSRLTVDGSNLIFSGNGAILKHENSIGFNVTKDSFNLEFSDFIFKGSFTPNDQITPNNAGIWIEGASTTALYEAHDIKITYCSFECGVFGIIATNVSNLTIYGCYFNGCVYRPELSAGGYAILEQSCINVTIEKCFFELGDYGRHDLYVSVYQAKTENIGSKNIYVHNCYSNRANMHVQSDGQFFGRGTVRIAIRSCTNLHVDGFYAVYGTGITAISNDDGPQKNIVFENIYLSNAKYLSSAIAPAESRFAFNVLGYQTPENYIEVKFNNVTIENCEENFGDFSGEADLIIYENSVINYIFIVTESAKKSYLVLNDVGVKGSGALRYNGSDTLIGEFNNLYNASDRAILNAGSSTNGKISLSCYPIEAKTFEISANNTVVWKNNNLVHPIMGAIDLSDNNFRKINLTYCTKPSGGLFVPYGAGTIGFFNFDVTHDLTESSFRLYSYASDGSIDRTKRGYVMIF